MQTSMIMDFFDRTWRAIPVVTATGFIIYFTVLATISVNNFVHRTEATAELCSDINKNQLPEIRARLTNVENELIEIKLAIKDIQLSVKELQVTVKDIQKEVHSQKGR